MAEITDLPGQLDTGADFTVVPAALVEQIGLIPFGTVQVSALGGVIIPIPTFLAHLKVRGHDPVLIKILSSTEEPHILLGRDILNRHRIVLDGPQSLLEIA